MTLPLERARSRRPVTWLTVLGVLLLPVLIGGILLTALYDPTERLGNVRAAIVNNDEPVTINGQTAPLGRQLTAGLVEGSSDVPSNLDWVISNTDDAASGLADGTYDAVITIPQNFSAAATSTAPGKTPEKATIQVQTAPDGRVVDGAITATITQTAASVFGSAVSQQYLTNVLMGFTTLHDQLGEAADGADQLASGAQQALSLVIDELVAPGDVVLSEELSWPGLVDPVRRRGARVHGVPMTPDGVDVDALEAAIVALRPVLIALNPHHHNPTGSRMPPASRLAVAELSARYGVRVIEDRVLANISFDGVVPVSLPGIAAALYDLIFVVLVFIVKDAAFRQLLSVHSAISATSGVCQARCWPPSSAIICPVIDGVSNRKRIVLPNSAGCGPAFRISPSIWA